MALRFFIRGYLAEKVVEPDIMRVEGNAMNLAHKFRVRDCPSALSALDHDGARFLLSGVPIGLSKPMVEILAKH